MKLFLESTNITINTDAIDVIEWKTNIVSIRGRLLEIHPKDTAKLFKMFHPEKCEQK